MMDGKTYLKNILYINADIESRLCEVKEADRMLKYAYKDSVRLGILDYRETIMQQAEEVANEKYECIRMIEQVDDVILQIILRDIYINQKTISEVADELNYTSRQLANLKSKAIKEFSAIYVREKKYG